MVEDLVLLRSLVAEELRACGCRVTETSRADEAIAFIDAGETFDLIFSDVRVPGDASGVDLARHARALAPDLPIFLTSATATPQDVHGDWVFVPKPYNIPDLVERLLRAAGSSAAAAP
jgi:CheY-like chemotaxis protein